MAADRPAPVGAGRDYDDPPLAPNEIRVRSLVTGVKRGTELTLYRGVGPFYSKRFDPVYRLMRETREPAYPRGLGSWGVGEVIAVGGAVERYMVGDLVHGNSRHRPTMTYALDAAGERGVLKGSTGRGSERLSWPIPTSITGLSPLS